MLPPAPRVVLIDEMRLSTRPAGCSNKNGISSALTPLIDDTDRVDNPRFVAEYAAPLIDETLLRASVEIDETVRLAGTPPATYGTPLMLDKRLMASVEMLWNEGFSGTAPGIYADPLMDERL
jgi:hypothetical protein